MERGADAWPGVWVPPMVREGWRGTNVAGYETDFYHNMMAQTPAFRTNYGDGEAHLRGIDRACARRNMTGQLCAGNPPSFLEARTRPNPSTSPQPSLSEHVLAFRRSRCPR